MMKEKVDIKVNIKNIVVLVIAYMVLFASSLALSSCSASSDGNNRSYKSIKSKISVKVATASHVEKDRRGIINEYDGTYLYDENGNLLKDYFYQQGGDYYYANKDGKLVASTFVAIDARTKSNVPLSNTEAVWYYFDVTGKAVKGKEMRIGSEVFKFNYGGRIVSELPSYLKHKEELDLSNKNIGDIVIFGSYDEKSNGEYVYLSWDLLDIKDDKALLSTCFIVDEKTIDEDYKWGNSELRTWLNNHFLNWAFKKNIEYDKVCETEIITDGEVTKDKVFLLSEEDVDKYYKDDLSEYKVTLASEKVLRKGLYHEENEMSPYCLRDSKNGDIKVMGADGKVYLSKDYNLYINEVAEEEYNAYIEYIGDEEISNDEIYEGYYCEEIYEYEWVDYNLYGIRPAVWVKIK